MSPSVSSLSFLCLLLLVLPASHGASSHGSYKIGSRQFFFRTPGKSSGNSQEASTAPPETTCSSIASAGLGNNKLTVVHRQSPCSPLHGQPSLAAVDVLRRDASHIRRRFSSRSSSSVVAAAAPSSAATIIPANGWYPSTLPGALDYSVLVSYGTPEQQFPVFLDNSFGTSVLRCKPCASNDCDPAFDTSKSLTFADVLCGSPDCPTNCTEFGSACPFDDQFSIEITKATFAKDVLTLAPSLAVYDFRFVCVEVDKPSHDLPYAGNLDLSRARNSLPSRLSSSWLPGPATFSYCLPQNPSSQGFLSLGGNATLGNDDYYNLTVHAPLISSSYPELSNLYFIDLVRITLGGEDLQVPPGTFGGNASANLDLGTTFTWLAPDAYAALRDGFRKGMSQYNNLLVPGFAGFDTCYNFTGLDELVAPGIELWFSNGEGWPIDGNQMFYYDDPAAGPFTMTCLAFSSLDASGDVFSAIIGTYTLASNEVMFDVAGGTVSFTPGRCL